jgi:hypothetical protein
MLCFFASSLIFLFPNSDSLSLSQMDDDCVCVCVKTEE